MKKVGLILLMVFILLVGCSNPVQDDLLTYLNEDLAELYELEAEAIEKYESVTGANYTDDFVLYDALTVEIIPIYSEFASQLESIEPETEEVQQAHDTYLRAVGLYREAFDLLVIAIEEQDEVKVDQVNEKLAHASQVMDEYNALVEVVAEENDVEIYEE